MNLPVLAVVIPCYNEADCISDTIQRLLEVLNIMQKNNEISDKSYIFCVDDGSIDETWQLIDKYNKETNLKVKGIRFSRNFGNQNAIIAGLFEASKFEADCYITIDADLQQDENKISEFVDKYKNGAQIVFGIRNDRKTDNFFKKSTALVFYKLMNILGVKIKVNHSDYRLVSKNIIETLKTFPETNMFLRGIFNDLGFNKDYVNFDVKQRKAGNTKFTPFSLLSLALNGITSFSIVPLRVVSFIGLLMSVISFWVGISAFIAKVFSGNVIPGWATIVVALGFIGGVQILCTGIIGEYLGQLFQEVKSRPRYIIQDRIN